MKSVPLLCFVVVATSSSAASWVARDVVIEEGKWRGATGDWEHMQGTNVVMKGPPWIPGVEGTEKCLGAGKSPGTASHNNCSNFNIGDVSYLKSQNMSVIRLGVTWAGGQPTPDPVLDPDFLERLHNILELCGNHSIRVILDLHQDAMGTAMCGEGVPMWFSQKHFPHLIG